MRKLKLDVEKLSVDSFQTAPGERKSGTVVGQSPITINITCESCESEYQLCSVELGATCDQSCWESCGGTCPCLGCGPSEVATCASCGGTCDGSPSCRPSCITCTIDCV